MQNRGVWLSGCELCDSRCSRRRNHYAATGLLCGLQYLGKYRPCVHHRPERPFGSEEQRRYQPGGVCRYAEDHRFQGQRRHRRAGNRQQARPDVGRPAAGGLGLPEQRRKLAEYDGAGRKNGVQCHRGAASHPEGDGHGGQGQLSARRHRCSDGTSGDPAGCERGNGGRLLLDHRRQAHGSTATRKPRGRLYPDQCPGRNPHRPVLCLL